MTNELSRTGFNLLATVLTSALLLAAALQPAIA